MEPSKATSFLPYLEEKQRRERARRAAPAKNGTALSILGALADAPGQRLGMTELQAASGMTIVDFADALKRLQASGYLVLSGEPGRESAELTALGEDVVKLTRSR